MLPPTFQIISSEGIGRINRLISFLSFLPFFCVRLGWWLWLRVAIASKGLSLSCRRHGSAKIWLAAALCTRFPHSNRLIRFHLVLHLLCLLLLPKQKEFSSAQCFSSASVLFDRLHVRLAGLVEAVMNEEQVHKNFGGNCLLRRKAHLWDLLVFSLRELIQRSMNCECEKLVLIVSK